MLVEFPAVTGIEDFYPKPWASWVTELYEDLINKHYHVLESLPGYDHLAERGWVLSDIYGTR
jgi:hypothetical protein